MTQKHKSVDLPAVSKATVETSGSPFAVFLSGECLREYRVGDAVTIKFKDGTATTKVYSRTQGSLYAMMGAVGPDYAAMRGRGFDPIVFADALEDNLPDANEPCDLRAFYTVIQLEALPLPAQQAQG